MPVTIEAEPFTTALRERFALKLEDGLDVSEVLAAFDRATTEAVFQSLNGQHRELTPQQKAGLTKRRNNALRKAQATVVVGGPDAGRTVMAELTGKAE
jgi:hypothetical protein